jgi:WD40 repeat protein
VVWHAQLMYLREVPSAQFQRDPSEMTLLRRVINAHSTDILSLSVSRLLSVIVTGCEDGLIRVWDLQVSCPPSRFCVHFGGNNSISGDPVILLALRVVGIL